MKREGYNQSIIWYGGEDAVVFDVDIIKYDTVALEILKKVLRECASIRMVCKSHVSSTADFCGVVIY